jgi:hypothetical protein
LRSASRAAHIFGFLQALAEFGQFLLEDFLFHDPATCAA